MVLHYTTQLWSISDFPVLVETMAHLFHVLHNLSQGLCRACESICMYTSLLAHSVVQFWEKVKSYTKPTHTLL